MVQVGQTRKGGGVEILEELCKASAVGEKRSIVSPSSSINLAAKETHPNSLSNDV